MWDGLRLTAQGLHCKFCSAERNGVGQFLGHMLIIEHRRVEVPGSELGAKLVSAVGLSTVQETLLARDVVQC